MFKQYTISALVANAGRVLLVKHKKLGFWIYPGGHLKPDEDMEQGLYREVYEETGCEIKILGSRDLSLGTPNVYILPNPYVIFSKKVFDIELGERQHIDFIYACQLKTGTQVKIQDSDEIEDLDWFTPDQIVRLNIPQEVRGLINRFMYDIPNLKPVEEILVPIPAEKRKSVSAILINEGKVLLVRHKRRGLWLAPGGHIDDNETPEEAVIREVFEETGLTIELIGEKDESLATKNTSVVMTPFAMLLEYIESSEGTYYYIDHSYCCRVISKIEPIPENEEFYEANWFTLDQLKSLNMPAELYATIRKAWNLSW